ncbi:MAG: hypothetical protein U0V54_09730 [Saprospiraceae bacterium]|nr:hypothetical protein [Saprospiraceae bacterium]
MMARIWVVIVFIIMGQFIEAQIPAEIFVGEKRATIDVMFFKYFKNTKEENSRWLFFHRNRASVDVLTSLRQQSVLFGFTEAISYNAPSLKGLAPVAVLSVLNGGLTPKAGVQYVSIHPQFTLFTWAVASLQQNTVLDYFLLMRYTPSISAKTRAFLQLESVNAIATREATSHSFTLRTRMGLKHHHFQWGVGLDQSYIGRNDFQKSTNPGIFVRYEF